MNRPPWTVALFNSGMGSRSHNDPHKRDGTGFQPSYFWKQQTWGVAPGWYGAGPSALNSSSVPAVQPHYSAIDHRPSTLSLSKQQTWGVAPGWYGAGPSALNSSSIPAVQPHYSSISLSEQQIWGVAPGWYGAGPSALNSSSGPDVQPSTLNTQPLPYPPSA